MREGIRARIDDDVEPLDLRERGTGSAQVDVEVEHELVYVDGSSHVPLHVALVRRAEQPWVDKRACRRRLHGDAEVDDGPVDARDIERLRTGLVHRRADVVGRRAERGRGTAVRADAVRAVDGVAKLEALESLSLHELESGPADEELVGNLARRVAAAQQDEAVIFANRRLCTGSRDGD